MFQIKRIQFHEATKAATRSPASSSSHHVSLLSKKTPQEEEKSVVKKTEQRTTSYVSGNLWTLDPIRPLKSAEWLCDTLDLYSNHMLLSSKNGGEVGIGLNNLGNTCYLNSVLQLLMHAPPLVSYLLHNVHSDLRRGRGTLRRSRGGGGGGRNAPDDDDDENSGTRGDRSSVLSHLYNSGGGGGPRSNGGEKRKKRRGRGGVAGFDMLLLMERLCAKAHPRQHAAQQQQQHRTKKGKKKKHTKRNGGEDKYFRRNMSSSSSLRWTEPVDIVRRLRFIGRNFRLGRQEDAHEFLLHVLQAMQRACLTYQHGLKANLSNLMSETTMVYSLFGGYIRSRVSCARCAYDSDTFDSFVDLSLELTRQVDSVQDALHEFTSSELLDNDNRWHCPKCKRKVRASKHMGIHVAPPLLLLHLKRFRFGRYGNKINRFVRYPERLRLDPFTTTTSTTTTKKKKKKKKGRNGRAGGRGNDATDKAWQILNRRRGDDVVEDDDCSLDPSQRNAAAEYRLRSIVVHLGDSMGSGHYVAYVRDGHGSWYLCDDARVRPTSLKNVLHQKAYMLCYEKVRLPSLPEIAVNGAGAAIRKKEEAKEKRPIIERMKTTRVISSALVHNVTPEDIRDDRPLANESVTRHTPDGHDNISSSTTTGREGKSVDDDGSGDSSSEMSDVNDEEDVAPPAPLSKLLTQRPSASSLTRKPRGNSVSSTTSSVASSASPSFWKRCSGDLDSPSSRTMATFLAFKKKTLGTATKTVVDDISVAADEGVSTKTRRSDGEKIKITAYDDDDEAHEDDDDDSDDDDIQEDDDDSDDDDIQEDDDADDGSSISSVSLSSSSSSSDDDDEDDALPKFSSESVFLTGKRGRGLDVKKRL
eukprot:g4511.t1